MLSMSSLWLPILVSAVGVFIASAILHMVLPIHKGDYKQLPDEEAVRAAMQKSPPAPGQYMVPFLADLKDFNTPEIQKKYAEGPVGMLTIQANGPVNMGKSLSIWFVLCVVVSDFCAYIAGLSLSAGSDYLKVFQVVGATAFMAYGLGEPANAIWRGQPWGTTFRHLAGGLVYALVTAGVFGWLWPQG